MTPSECALIIPASGFSKRFGEADKLLSDLNGRPLADYAAQTAAKIGFAQMIAVVPPGNTALAAIYKARGFNIIKNDSACLGQTHTITIGASVIDDRVNAICIMLADMPLVKASHVNELIVAAPEDGVIKTAYQDHLQPPAVFTGRALEAWTRLNSMGGHLSYLAITKQETSLPLAVPYGDDIDTPEDLARLSRLRLK